MGAAQPAMPRRCHHSPTVKSGSQLSSSHARSSSTSSRVLPPAVRLSSTVVIPFPLLSDTCSPEQYGSSAPERVGGAQEDATQHDEHDAQDGPDGVAAHPGSLRDVETLQHPHDPEQAQ